MRRFDRPRLPRFSAVYLTTVVAIAFLALAAFHRAAASGQAVPPTASPAASRSSPAISPPSIPSPQDASPTVTRATEAPASVTPTPSPIEASAERASSPTAEASSLGRLAYVQSGDIWVKDLPDGNVRQLTTDGASDTPHWSPTGQWVLYRSGQRELRVVRTDRADDHAVGASQAAWAPSRDVLIGTIGQQKLTVDADGSNRQVVPLSDADRGLRSPDGQWQVIDRLDWQPMTSAGRVAQSAGLIREQADGADATEIYREPNGSGTCTKTLGWSPDSRFILFWRHQECGAASPEADGFPLRAIPVRGGAPLDLSARTLLYPDFFSWSPNGKSLAFVDGGGRSTWYGKRIAFVSLPGAPRILSDPSRADLFPAWSPDGQWIAYTSAPAIQTDGGDEAKQASDQRRIWLMRPDGADKHQLILDKTTRDERPEWSPDGSEILFARLWGGTAQIWLVRADGAEARSVASLSPAPDWFGYYGYVNWGRLYDWHP